MVVVAIFPKKNIEIFFSFANFFFFLLPFFTTLKFPDFILFILLFFVSISREYIKKFKKIPLYSGKIHEIKAIRWRAVSERGKTCG